MNSDLKKFLSVNNLQNLLQIFTTFLQEKYAYDFKNSHISILANEKFGPLSITSIIKFLNWLT